MRTPEAWVHHEVVGRARDTMVWRLGGPCSREADWLWPKGSVIMSVFMFFLMRCLHRHVRLLQIQTAKPVTLTLLTGS